MEKTRSKAETPRYSSQSLTTSLIIYALFRENISHYPEFLAAWQERLRAAPRKRLGNGVRQNWSGFGCLRRSNEEIRNGDGKKHLSTKLPKRQALRFADFCKNQPPPFCKNQSKIIKNPMNSGKKHKKKN